MIVPPINRNYEKQQTCILSLLMNITINEPFPVLTLPLSQTQGYNTHVEQRELTKQNCSKEGTGYHCNLHQHAYPPKTNILAQ